MHALARISGCAKHYEPPDPNLPLKSRVHHRIQFFYIRLARGYARDGRKCLLFVERRGYTI